MPKRVYQNFFELQRRYKKNSMVLYALFVMAMMIHVVFALLFFMLIWWMIFGDLTGFAWFWMIILVPSYFIISVLYHYHKVIHDDDFLLKDIEVTRLFMNTSGMDAFGMDTSDNHHSPDDHKRKKHQVMYAKEIKDFEPAYRRYYEFAEQLAIACNLTLPKLYVMNEKGVNAFVAGFHETNMILVVSQGALDLDNESLYGLIGHEYGHILHGDAKLNVQMYVLMSGLSWLYDLADGLEWLSKWRQESKVRHYYYPDDDANRKEYVMVTNSGRLSVEFLSLIIRLLGFLGMVSSEWIKQHFNQQREFLADATSVQLTRSHGVAELLQTLERTPYLARTQKSYTTHLSYFFFLNPQDAHAPLNWCERIQHRGSTHPSHGARIKALRAHEYDEFAKMATEDLDISVLQNTHDKMMLVDFYKKSANDKAIEFVALDNADGAAHDKVIDQKTNAITIPVYEHEFQISYDKVINGRLVVEDTWDNGTAKDEMIYPNQAKADHELKNITYVDMNHVKNMTLPLMIDRYLRNDDVKGEMSELFLLFYAVIFCHDSQGILVNHQIYLNDVFSLKKEQQESNKNHPLNIPKELLKTVANMDRRIDNGLLLILYQRLSQDIRHDNKKEGLQRDYLRLIIFIHHPHKNNSNEGLMVLWKGVHLYRLLCVFSECDFADTPLYKKLNFIHHKYDINLHEWVMMNVMIYMVISHDEEDNHTQEKALATIYRLMRLINHHVIIDNPDLHRIIAIMKSFSAIDMALLLLKYHDTNSLTAKRYIDTLHTALLSDGMLCERDHEILLTLHQHWCPNDVLSVHE